MIHICAVCSGVQGVMDFYCSRSWSLFTASRNAQIILHTLYKQWNISTHYWQYMFCFMHWLFHC